MQTHILILLLGCNDTTNKENYDSGVAPEYADSDNDGISTADDCDDSNPDSTTVTEDADCDGIPTADDCDDFDPSTVNDMDCDGVLSVDDCDDSNPDSTTVAEDADCDGIPTADDCDDFDPSMPDYDMDCDGISTADDCDDSNPDSTTVTEDADCDGIPTADDCDDFDPSTVNDMDCDGVLSVDDCDDSNANVNPDMGEILFDDADNNCDGVTDQISAEDYTAAVTGSAGNYLSFDNAISLSDVTGDGVPDLFIGGTFVGDSVNDALGTVYMLDGSGYESWDGLVTDYSTTSIEGSGLMNYFALMSSTQGDVDGDGNIDLLVGGTDAVVDYADDGYAYITAAIFSNAGSLNGDYTAGEANITFTSESADYPETASNYGAARVANHLDLNGDGQNEFIFGSYLGGYYTTGGYWQNYGTSVCSYGGCLSYLSIFNGSELSDGEYNITEDATQFFEESTVYDYFGQTITGGDFDGDGADELIIGVPGSDEVANGSGCIAIYKGSEDLVTDTDYPYEYDQIDFLLYYDGALICGETTGARLGWNAGGVLGDLNGDGLQDLVISGPGANQVFVFYDAESLMGASPYNADSDADVVITSGSGPDFFGYALAVGDFDGDGVDDLAIGAPDLDTPIEAAFEYNSLLYNDAPNDNGMVYIFDGSSLSGSMSEEDADATIYSENTDYFGISIIATDMNNDGKEDLWIGAPYHNSDEGRATLYVME